MFSEPLIKKWKKFLKKKYNKDLTKQEVFEVVNTLTNYFEILIKFNKDNSLENQNYEDKYESKK